MSKTRRSRDNAGDRVIPILRQFSMQVEPKNRPDGAPREQSGLPRPARILLISDCPVWPTNMGGNQRTNLFYRSLKPFGEVGFLGVSGREPRGSMADLDLPADFQSLGMVCLGQPDPIKLDDSASRAARWINNFKAGVARRTAAFRRNAAASDAVARLIGEWSPDLVVCRHLNVALSLDLPRVAKRTGVRLILDVDDIPWEIWQTQWRANDKLRLDQRLREAWSDRSATRLILAMIEGVDAVGVAKASDRRWFLPGRCELVRNIPFDGFADSDAASGAVARERPGSPMVLIVASFNHLPNAQGAAWFAQQVWPRILDKVPDATLAMVGRGAASELQALAAPGTRIEVFSDVPDVGVFYDRARVAVAPVQVGSGTKIKVLEALAHGVPCVATDHCGAGFEGEFEALFLAGEPAAFAARCIALLEKPEAAFAKAQRDSIKVRSEWTFDSFARQVAKLVGQKV
jgi:glycosyltransferase involved in cell wall biosynthesis